MTWQKLGTEFWDDCARAGLSDAAVRTHGEGIGWVYSGEAYDLRIQRHLIRRFAGSPDYERAVLELVERGFWRDDGDLVIVHHADVIRQSLAAQQGKRDRDQRAQARARARKPVSDDVSADASDDVSDYTDRQTDSRDSEHHEEVLNGCTWRISGAPV